MCFEAKLGLVEAEVQRRLGVYRFSAKKSVCTESAEMSRDTAGMIPVKYLYRFLGQPVRTAGILGVRYGIFITMVRTICCRKFFSG